MKLKKYVLGFMFDADMKNVVLIQKNHPEWQKGKFNGTGGHIKEGETNFEAMVREHDEETGIYTTVNDWTYFGSMGNEETFEVDLFACKANSPDPVSKTDEEVELMPMNVLESAWNLCIENLPWLIHLAIDCLRDGRPMDARINYPQSSKE